MNEYIHTRIIIYIYIINSYYFNTPIVIITNLSYSLFTLLTY